MSSKRICKICSKELSYDQFALASNKEHLNSKGLPYRRKICIPCYTKVKRSECVVRMKWFDEYKRTLSCAKCGFNDHRALDFHHEDPSKKEANLGDLVKSGSSKKRIFDEISKCIVLCSNCHRIHHYEERYKPS